MIGPLLGEWTKHCAKIKVTFNSCISSSLKVYCKMKSCKCTRMRRKLARLKTRRWAFLPLVSSELPGPVVWCLTLGLGRLSVTFQLLLCFFLSLLSCIPMCCWDSLGLLWTRPHAQRSSLGRVRSRRSPSEASSLPLPCFSLRHRFLALA